ncbi:MAG: hypothetical protein FWD89_02960 [Firmicutes bacterium]|nr:hypothetical protein [Bacillota bacterium]MCL2771251.1 hypothetical protein [Bacillota bacterium]
MGLAISVNCPLCGHNITSSSARGADGRFLCPECNNTFSLLEARDAARGAARRKEAEASKPQIPHGWENYTGGNDMAATALLREAYLFLDKGDQKSALVCFNEMIEKNKNNAAAWLGKAQISIMQQNVVSIYNADVNLMLINGDVSDGKIKKYLRSIRLTPVQRYVVFRLIKDKKLYMRVNTGYATHAMDLAQSKEEKSQAMGVLISLQNRFNAEVVGLEKKFNTRKKLITTGVVFATIGAIGGVSYWLSTLGIFG